MDSIIKRMNYFVWSCCLVVIGSNTVWAQEQRELSLDSAIALGLGHSKALKISDSKVHEAIAAVREAKDNRLPDIDISGQYLRVNKPNLNIKFGDDSDSDDGEGDDGGSTPEVNQVMFGMATASLPIFAGGTINNGIASATFLEKAASFDAERDKQKVVQNTIEAYYNLYKAQAAVKLVKENIKSSQQRVKDFTNMEANGLVARNDLLKVQLQESNLELSLLTAENNEKIANYNFNLLLGIDESTVLALDTTGLKAQELSRGLNDWETLALSNRADYKALGQRQEAAGAGIKIAKGAYLPSLAISAGYVAADIPHALTVTNAVNAGVGLKYNLGALYKAGAKVKQAQAREEQLNWSHEQLSDNIKSEIHKAFQDYNQTLKKIQVYEKAVEQANENYRITKNKYDNSLATTTDLLDADVARLQAGIDYAYAKADAVVAYHKLYESAGVNVGE